MEIDTRWLGCRDRKNVLGAEIRSEAIWLHARSAAASVRPNDEVKFCIFNIYTVGFICATRVHIEYRITEHIDA